MPTLPLYAPDAPPDAWHRVASPGGYEHWTFSADAADQGSHLAVTFAHGYAFHPAYLRAYARYRRLPTRFPPPVPADYVCVLASVLQAGSPPRHLGAHYPAAAFSAANDRFDVRIGPNRCFVGDDGGVHIILALPAFSADLCFTPRAVVRPTESRRKAPENHVFEMTRPWCDVSGSLDGVSAKPLSFQGSGYQDHYYGTTPVAPALHQWLRGSAAFPGRAFAFELRRAARPGHPDEVRLLRYERGQVFEIPHTPPRADGFRRASFLQRYPAQLDFGGALMLTKPRLIGQTPFTLVVGYTASTGDGLTTPSTCHITRPDRMCRAVVGRMIERWIRRID